MNRRQNIAVYVTGLLLAGISLHNGQQHGEWLFESFIPVFIVGGLAIHWLREKASDHRDDGANLKKGAAALLVVALGAHMHGRIASVGWDAAQAEEHAQDAIHAADEGKSEADELKGKLDDVERRIDYLEIEARYRH